MADIELVIKIPKSQYKTLNARTQEDVVDIIDDKLLIDAIKNGIALPKGHGRLVDAGEYVDVLNNAQIEGLNTYKGLGRAKELLIETHTIIEADKEE